MANPEEPGNEAGSPSSVRHNCEAPSLTFYGHCAFVVTSHSGKKVLTDPWRNHNTWAPWFELTFPALDGIDVIISTHTHFDHDNVLCAIESSPDALILQGGDMEEGQNQGDGEWKQKVHLQFGTTMGTTLSESAGLRALTWVAG